ncbi:hypothetical protein OGAPHI_007177 [Ogataea philodendri]|uniref:Matrin-type domain-containing protein n=1 Tax=Ogataea philodendri TaxID=1378263 RepID=A0A9P8NUN9_9ASCO|nr:uncharacterized protein OGAPHI_007177 [Ogataea philodendri]KAH3659972.1 hypothetical protein OGAPHI_007177 [Ogataea philodendri]
MPKYYCDYCKSYLTHDSLSVRKSHLQGRNHLSFYCEYYEEVARKNGLLEPNELPWEYSLKVHYGGMPGTHTAKSELQLPPPPTLNGFPNPPAWMTSSDTSAEKKTVADWKRATEPVSDLARPK